MIKKDGIPLDHWNFLIALDEDLSRLSRYIEFAKSNLGTYSIETLRILFAAAAEADVVAKRLCKRISPDRAADNIDHYRAIIMRSRPVLADVEVRMERYGLRFKPWSNWRRRDPSNPDWWRAYNAVKHHRDSAYPKASLRHALYAVTGLYVLNLFFYEDEGREGRLRPHPDLLMLGAPFGNDAVLYHPSGDRVYRLDVEAAKRKRRPRGRG